jgi:hypothetical protein
VLRWLGSANPMAFAPTQKRTEGSRALGLSPLQSTPIWRDLGGPPMRPAAKRGIHPRIWVRCGNEQGASARVHSMDGNRMLIS